MLTGIAERKMRKAALSVVSEGLVCHTNLKNCGRLFNAENRSFKLMSAIKSKNKNNCYKER
jgi:hypothetical protein